MQALINRPLTDETNVTNYIIELCSTVNSCAIFVSFIGKNEPRYQHLLKVVPLLALHRRTRRRPRR